MKIMIRVTCAAFAVSLALGTASAGGLSELNAAARGTYAKGRATLLSKADPVIVVAFDDVVLRRGGERTSVTYVPPLYHRLKALAHLPLGIFGTLIPVASGAASDEGWRDDLGMLIAAANEARADIAAIEASPAIKAAAQKLLEESLSFMTAQRMAKAAPDMELLQGFARRVAPFTLTLATEAAYVQLDGLHAVVQRWKSELGAEPWSKLQVLVLGPKTPRVDNAA